MIRNFYKRGFNEVEIHKSWPWIWSKHYRIETIDHRFVKLNRFRNRLNFESLSRYCQGYVPLHVYMSALNWLMPERVGLKDKASGAYPVFHGLIQDYP